MTSTMLAFLVGPSRAGKSTLVATISSQFSDIAFVNLDDEMAEVERRLRSEGTSDLGGWEGRWRRSREIFDHARTEDKNVVIDVGAGSLQTAAAFRYFEEYVSDIILIWAPFEAILLRHGSRDADELRRAEFSPAHTSLYGRIDRCIDTSGLDIQRAAQMLGQHLRALRQEGTDNGSGQPG